MVKLCSDCGINATSTPKKLRCAHCQRLIKQAGNRGASSVRMPIPADVAAIAIKRSIELSRGIHKSTALAFACHYSHIPLIFDSALSHQGDYVSFDHVIPNNSSEAVLCSRITNDLKGWMTEKEFRKFIIDCAETDACRSLHGLTRDETRDFFLALRIVMSEPSSQTTRSVGLLKSLSSKLHYCKAITVIDVQPNHLDGPAS